MRHREHARRHHSTYDDIKRSLLTSHLSIEFPVYSLIWNLIVSFFTDFPTSFRAQLPLHKTIVTLSYSRFCSSMCCFPFAHIYINFSFRLTVRNLEDWVKYSTNGSDVIIECRERRVESSVTKMAIDFRFSLLTRRVVDCSEGLSEKLEKTLRDVW